MSYMFGNKQPRYPYSRRRDPVFRNFNGDLSKWDVSGVTNMKFMFYDAFNFAGDLSKWDVSKVTDMSYMFQGNTADYNSRFNGDLSKWDVSRVTDMKLMFHSAYNFNGDLSKWDVSKVQNADSMFSGTELYVQCLCDRLPFEFSVACHSSCTRYLAHTAPLVLV